MFISNVMIFFFLTRGVSFFLTNYSKLSFRSFKLLEMAMNYIFLKRNPGDCLLAIFYKFCLFPISSTPLFRRCYVASIPFEFSRLRTAEATSFESSLLQLWKLVASGGKLATSRTSAGHTFRCGQHIETSWTRLLWANYLRSLLRRFLSGSRLWINKRNTQYISSFSNFSPPLYIKSKVK